MSTSVREGSDEQEAKRSGRRRARIFLRVAREYFEEAQEYPVPTCKGVATACLWRILGSRGSALPLLCSSAKAVQAAGRLTASYAEAWELNAQFRLLCFGRSSRTTPAQEQFILPLLARVAEAIDSLRKYLLASEQSPRRPWSSAEYYPADRIA